MEEKIKISTYKFRVKFLRNLVTMYDWKSLEKVLQKMSKENRVKVLKGTFDDHELETGIIRACSIGNLEAVVFLVEMCDVDVKKVKDICLFNSVSEGHFLIAKYFIETHSADVNYHNDQKMAVIHYACCRGDEKTVEYLVEHGADMTSEDHVKVNCLMAGAWAGSVKICEMALKAGVDVNAKTANGEHILHGTIRQGGKLGMCRLDTVKFLVKAGADVNSVNEDDLPVVVMAALNIKDSTKTLGFFLKHPQVRKADKVKAMKLSGSHLISMGNESRGFKFWTRAIEMQLRYPMEDMNKNSKDQHLDIFNHDPKTVEDVKNMKKDPEAMVRFMISICADLHVTYNYDNMHNMLALAEMTIDSGCVNLFLEVFAFVFLHSFCEDENIDSIPDQHNTSRTLCAIRVLAEKFGDKVFPEIHLFYKKMTRGFIKKENQCKNVPSKNKERKYSGKKLIHDARHLFAKLFWDDFSEEGNEELSEDELYDDYSEGKHKFMFMWYMMKLSTLILEVFPTKKDVFLPSLCQLIQTNFRDEKGSTFLHIAIECLNEVDFDEHADEESHVELVKLMIINGAPVNALDNYWYTPAHCLGRVGCSSNHDLIQEIADLLVENGAHLDIRCKTGKSAVEELQFIRVSVPALRNQTLQCLAAKVIMLEQIEYHNSTPKSLWNFIELHNEVERIDEDDVPFVYPNEDTEDEHFCDV